MDLWLFFIGYSYLCFLCHMVLPCSMFYKKVCMFVIFLLWNEKLFSFTLWWNYTII